MKEEKREKKDEQHTDREIIMGMRLEHRHLSQWLKNIYIWPSGQHTNKNIYIYIKTNKIWTGRFICKRIYNTGTRMGEE